MSIPQHNTFYDYGLCVVVVALAAVDTPVIGNFTRHIISIRIRSIYCALEHVCNSRICPLLAEKRILRNI